MPPPSVSALLASNTAAGPLPDINALDERVLVVPRTAIESTLKQGFFDAQDADLIEILTTTAAFLDRKLAEEDPSHKQIIPYVLVTNKGRYLVYQRTSNQGESRLHDKFSLGFGGHINELDSTPGRSTNLILSAMIRELNEEIFLPSVRQTRLSGFINDDSNPVGQVHLGVVFIVETISDEFAVNEPDMIKAKWCSEKEIEDLFPRLESWSQLLWRAYQPVQGITSPTPTA